MLLYQTVTDEDYSYAVAIRRKLHRHPELGFDLERTVACVGGELAAMGIPFTDRYGKCSLVAELNGNRGLPTLALRADMDALPIQEKTDVPFRSEIDGAMHACGHDAHTAILLTAARVLKRAENTLPCRVKLLFQPSEEGVVSGAQMMTDNGVMDDVDAILCTHAENALDAGLIGVHAGDYMAGCIPIDIRFYGRAAHAAMAEQGADAIAMAVQAYTEMKAMVAGEAGDRIPYVFSVGSFQGGHVHNVIADRCELKISFRFYDRAFAARVTESVERICAAAAAAHGGTAQVDWHISAGPVHNDEALTARFIESARKAVGGAVVEVPRRMSSEDFACYLTKGRGMIFRFGTRNEAEGCTTLAHQDTFKIDERGMRTAIKAFVQFAADFSAAGM